VAVDPYREPTQPPAPASSRPWRDRARWLARVVVALALPFGVGWLITMGVRRARCSAVSYVRLLWGAPGLALACSIGIMLLLLTGARFFRRE